ncbi:hypothetical protein P1X15_26335 [Runella sp. MFBS21]|uniref:hypothetical protein n=1 Tax=Runella sp. MFBS21 TaxID=3034018 RepID=UPI0023F8612A|nr:hypothetical protein [Runella sp. MFBS21]MDF7821169.1 hypothetical protein [Runella sp. MFBS21]
MNSMTPNDLDALYQLRNKFLIIGLTGRLGSGCSTVATMLCHKSFDDCNFPKPITTEFKSNEERKYRIVYNYLEKNWKQFTLIRASDIITMTLCLKDLEALTHFLLNSYKDDIINAASVINQIKKNIEYNFNSLQKKIEQLFEITKESPVYEIKKGEDEKSSSRIKKEVNDLFFINKELSAFTGALKTEFSKLKSKTRPTPFQLFGDNIRKTGNPLDSSTFLPKNSYIIAEVTNQLIKIFREHNEKSAHIVIDSIRNSMEARYFKERFSAFYLFAVNTENEHREKRLSSEYNAEELKSIDNEYNRNLKTEETFYVQDIKTCIQVSDIYLYNPNDKEKGDTYTTIKKDVVRYLALIFQPGIITPTPQERCMQIAYTAKYNSGCISRQVGAVVTDDRFSIKSIGWNNTPEGQTPCLLRNVDDLLHNSDPEAFSEYEKTSEIKQLLKTAYKSIDKSRLKGRNVSFCFKEGQNCLEHEKNQVHTRSLHAEENAMLQIAKYGGEGLTKGFLFTSASPCELCSKKAYQLGIKQIFYIDPYPGISVNQILISGVEVHKPKLILFIGAIGRAYHNLFEPFMAYKDELKTLLNYDYEKSNLNILQSKASVEKGKYMDDIKKRRDKLNSDLITLNPEELNKLIESNLDKLMESNPDEYRRLITERQNKIKDGEEIKE